MNGALQLPSHGASESRSGRVGWEVDGGMAEMGPQASSQLAGNAWRQATQPR